jgi:hypothetical protein
MFCNVSHVYTATKILFPIHRKEDTFSHGSGKRSTLYRMHILSTVHKQLGYTLLSFRYTYFLYLYLPMIPCHPNQPRDMYSLLWPGKLADLNPDLLNYRQVRYR